MKLAPELIPTNRWLVLFFLGYFANLFISLSTRGFGSLVFWPLYRNAAVSTAPGYFLILQLVILAATATLILTIWYRAWSTIQDGHARTTPGRAIALLFVPLFNLYWVFVVVWGFAKDYNALVARHRIPFPKLPTGLFLAVSILSVTVWLPLVGFFSGLACAILGLIVLSRTCDVANNLYRVAISQATSSRAGGLQPRPTPRVYSGSRRGGRAGARLAGS